MLHRWLVCGALVFVGCNANGTLVPLKNTGVCPKCTSTEIRVMRRKMWATMIPVGPSVFGAVYTSWFTCVSCGFVESWVESKEGLEKIRKKLNPR